MTYEQVGLAVNQRIIVALEGSGEYYVSSVEDITSEEVFISVPYRRQIPLMLSRGDRVRVEFSGDNECFAFVTAVTGRREEGILLYSLAFPDEIERIQRRRDVRLAVMLDVAYALAPEGDAAAVFKEAKALDLSAGGIRLVTDQDYPPGTFLLVKFRLPMRNDFFETVTKAEVIRTEPVVLEKKRLHHLGLKFIDMPQAHKDKIFSYIFWKMMEQARLR
ncbi:MAG: flagellar brake domain-containing protein [Bacillota bacterium]